MARRVSPYVALALFGVISGCSYMEPAPRRPAWRNAAENACLAEHPRLASQWLRPENPINGPGICGMQRPFRMTALANGTVTLNSHFILACPMIEAMNRWIATIVQPAAQARFGENVVEISSMGTYACRTIDNRPGGRLSEHSFGNAMDVGGFRLADGRMISIVHDWTRGGPRAQAFLRDVEGGACEDFTTVMGPGADRFHFNHFHLDLAFHGNTSHGPRRYCRPRPQRPMSSPRIDNLPDPPHLQEPLDVANRDQAPMIVQQSLPRGRGPSLDVPPQVVAVHTFPVRGYQVTQPPQGFSAPLAVPSPPRKPKRPDPLYGDDSIVDWNATSSLRK